MIRSCFVLFYGLIYWLVVVIVFFFCFQGLPKCSLKLPGWDNISGALPRLHIPAMPAVRSKRGWCGCLQVSTTFFVVNYNSYYLIYVYVKDSFLYSYLVLEKIIPYSFSTDSTMFGTKLTNS